MLGLTHIVLYLTPPLCWMKPDLIFPLPFVFPTLKGAHALREMWSSPPAPVQAVSGGRAGRRQHTQKGRTILGLLSPQMVSSDTVTLLCTAGPGRGSLTERGLVKVHSSFIVLQAGVVMTWTARVLPCFLFDGRCGQLQQCQLLHFNWPSSGPPAFLPFQQLFFFF